MVANARAAALTSDFLREVRAYSEATEPNFFSNRIEHACQHATVLARSDADFRSCFRGGGGLRITHKLLGRVGTECSAATSVLKLLLACATDAEGAAECRALALQETVVSVMASHIEDVRVMNVASHLLVTLTASKPHSSDGLITVGMAGDVLVVVAVVPRDRGTGTHASATDGVCRVLQYALEIEAVREPGKLVPGRIKEGVGALVDLLREHASNDVIVEHVVRTLDDVSRSALQAHECISRGSITAVVDVLRAHVTSVPIASCALALLRKLLQVSPDAVRALCTGDGMHALTQVLQTQYQHPDVAAGACGVLQECATFPCISTILVESGALAAILTAVRYFTRYDASKAMPILRPALYTLERAAEAPSAVDALQQLGAVRSVLNALQMCDPGDTGMLASAACLLERLCTRAPPSLQLAAAEASYKLLLTHCDCARIVAAAAAVLTHCPSFEPPCNALEVLLGALEVHQSNCGVATAVWSLLSQRMLQRCHMTDLKSLRTADAALASLRLLYVEVSLVRPVCAVLPDLLRAPTTAEPLRRGGLGALLAATLREHPHELGIANSCCESLLLLRSDVESYRAFAAAGGALALVLALRTHGGDRDAALLILAALQDLLTKDGLPSLAATVAEVVATSTADVLVKYKAERHLVDAACAALKCVFTVRSAGHAFVHARGCAALLSALQCQTDDAHIAQEICATAARLLAAGVSGCELQRVGFSTELLVVLSKHAKHASVVAPVCTLLSQVFNTGDEAGAPPASVASGSPMHNLRVLADVLRRHPDETKMVTSVSEVLLRCRPDELLGFSSAGGFAGLARCIRAQESRTPQAELVVQAAARVLSSLASLHSCDTEIAAKALGHEQLHALIEAAPSLVRLLGEACGASETTSYFVHALVTLLHGACRTADGRACLATNFAISASSRVIVTTEQSADTAMSVLKLLTVGLQGMAPLSTSMDDAASTLVTAYGPRLSVACAAEVFQAAFRVIGQRGITGTAIGLACDIIALIAVLVHQNEFCKLWRHCNGDKVLRGAHRAFDSNVFIADKLRSAMALAPVQSMPMHHGCCIMM